MTVKALPLLKLISQSLCLNPYRVSWKGHAKNNPLCIECTFHLSAFGYKGYCQENNEWASFLTLSSCIVLTSEIYVRLGV